MERPLVVWKKRQRGKQKVLIQTKQSSTPEVRLEFCIILFLTWRNVFWLCYYSHFACEWNRLWHLLVNQWLVGDQLNQLVAFQLSCCVAALRQIGNLPPNQPASLSRSFRTHKLLPLSHCQACLARSLYLSLYLIILLLSLIRFVTRLMWLLKSEAKSFHSNWILLWFSDGRDHRGWFNWSRMIALILSYKLSYLLAKKKAVHNDSWSRKTWNKWDCCEEKR